jgi:intracellular multiplication protein IcmO
LPILKVEQSDVDMRDVVLNRRILVVNLPALESSDERLAALGKIVVASLRGMMAQMLGARLEGDYQAIVANKPGMGAAPFHVVLDEVAYYATSGMDRMLAMGGD